MNPYSQLHMMQQAGAGQFIPGLGTMAPAAGGSSQLQAMSKLYGSPVAGNPLVDTSPMSSLNYQGPGSGMLNLAGNLMLTPMMQSQGMLPMGNAGSYMQAQRQNQFQEMQGDVIQDVAGQDTEGIFRSIRGAAALAGTPMDREQTKAAREFAQTIAEQGPLLGLLAPGLLDAMSGETGSVQAMAAQITNANRYMTDPTTGQLGFSKDSNKELIDGLFESMFNQDNTIKMQGLRAGEMGELYSRMSVEGLAGPKASLRDRTIGAVRDIQNEGGNADVDVALNKLSSYDSDNLETLSNKDLATLRESSSAVSSRITEADTDRISSQLQDYVKSLSAIREVFGENGNPNAPIPELVGALEALTSGKMQQFDATRLNTMVRDMQALSQASGKSIDQITAMQQNNATAMNKMMGYGGEHFASSATSYGVTTGQAFQQVGGATGFGALSREDAEAASQSLFQRSLSSEMANTLGALGRLEDSGSLEEGQDLSNAIAAVRQGDEFYTDAKGNQRRTPVKENEFRQLIAGGGAGDLEVGDFNLMLGQTYANREALAENQDLQKGAVRQQFFEFEREADRSAANFTMKLSDFEGVKPNRKRSVALSISRAANDAMFALTPEEFADDELRQKVMTEAIQAEAEGVDGLELDEIASERLADNIYAQSNRVAMRRTGGGTLALMQVQGRQVSNVQRSAEAQSQALSNQNEAMSVLGQKGSGMRRLFTALQKQGDKGEGADLNTLIGDIFGAEDINAEDLSESMQEVKELMDKSDDLRGRLDGAPADERRSIEKELGKVNADLMEAAETAQTEGRRLGVNAESGTFNLEDQRRSREALAEIDVRTDRSGLRDFIKNDSPVNAEALNSLKGKLTQQDIASLDKAAGTTSSKPELTEGVVDREKLEEVLTSEASTGSVFKGTFAVNTGMNSPFAKNVSDTEFNKKAEASLEEAFESIKDDPQQLRNAVATGEAVMADDRFNARARPAFKKYQKIAEERLKKLEADKKDEEPKDPAARDYSKLEANELTDEEKKVVLRERKLTELDKGPAVNKKEVENRMAKRRQELSPDQAEFSEDENYDDFELARSQLLAERSLQAIGVLDKKDSLMKPSNIDFEGAGISEEAINLIRSGDPAKQLKAVQKIATSSRSKARDSGLQRLADIDEKDTAAVAESLSVLSASADEYLLDTDAITKGGSIGEAAAKDMQEALSDLQALANEHSVQKGDLGPAELLQAGVYGTGPDGEKVQDEIDSIRLRIKKAAAGMEEGSRNDYKNVTTVTDEQRAAAEGVLGEGLSDAQIKAYSLLEKTKAKNIKEVKTASYVLGGEYITTRDTTIKPNTKKPTLEEVTELAGNLIKLKDADEDDISLIGRQQRSVAAAERAYDRSDLKEVMTKEEYKNAVTGKDSKPAEDLRLFKGDAKKLETVEGLLEDRTRQQKSLGRQEFLLEQGSNSEKNVEKAKKQLHETQEELKTFARKEGMSVEELTKAMPYQDDLKKLLSREFEGDLDEGTIKAIDTLKEAALQEREKQEKLSKPEGIIRKALGFGADDDDELDLGSSKDNTRMLAEELEKLQTIDSKSLGLAADATGIEKLDAMQDKYANATTSEQKTELADMLGLDRKQLDRSMARTDFMGLDKIEMNETSTPFERAKLLEGRLKGVETRSIQEEVKAEEARELKVTGNLTVRGDINGEAVLSDVVGLTSYAGTV